MKRLKKKEPLVSVVTPSFNSENTIKYTIDSVLNQTYKNIELIIVDDLSTDNTVNIVKEYIKKDNRVKLFVLKEKGGASAARNKAIKESHGKYVAFLDADDLWKLDKLEKQIKFMEDNHYDFTYTDYQYIDMNGNYIDKFRNCPKKVTYKSMLRGDSIGCLTVIYNQRETGLIQIPALEKRNDYALWCLILKKVKVGYKYNEILAYYRKNSGTLSSVNKHKLLKYHYRLHRNVNRLNIPKSILYTSSNVFNYFINVGIRDKKMNVLIEEEVKV